MLKPYNLSNSFLERTQARPLVSFKCGLPIHRAVEIRGQRMQMSPPDSSNQLTLFQSGGWIMSTKILLLHPSPRHSWLPTALHTLCRLLLPSADYVNRKSPVMTICIVKWWPFSNQTNIQCYSSILQHGKVPTSTNSWSIRLLFLLHPGFKP